MRRFYAAKKIPKDVGKSMDALQRAMYEKCAKHGDKGCTEFEILYVGKPYVNEAGEKRFASSARIYKNLRLLVSHGIIIVR